MGVNDGKIRLRDEKKAAIIDQLTTLGFKSMKNDDEDGQSAKNFDYLLSMPLYSLTKEKVTELNGKVASLQAQIKELESKTIEDLWLADLDKFQESYQRELDSKNLSAQSVDMSSLPAR